jgi:hypothetical protein
VQYAVTFFSGGINVHGGVIGLPVKGDVSVSGQSPRLVMMAIVSIWPNTVLTPILLQVIICDCSHAGPSVVSSRFLIVCRAFVPTVFQALGYIGPLVFLLRYPATSLCRLNITYVSTHLFQPYPYRSCCPPHGFLSFFRQHVLMFKMPSPFPHLPLLPAGYSRKNFSGLSLKNFMGASL